MGQKHFQIILDLVGKSDLRRFGGEGLLIFMELRTANHLGELGNKHIHFGDLGSTSKIQ